MKASQELQDRVHHVWNHLYLPSELNCRLGIEANQAGRESIVWKMTVKDAQYWLDVAENDPEVKEALLLRSLKEL